MDVSGDGPRAFLARLNSLTARFEAESKAFAETTKQAATTVVRPEVSIRVNGTTIEGLRFTGRGATSHAQLRTAVMQAYAEGQARSNAHLANAAATILGSNALAQSVRGSLGPEAAAAAAGRDLPTATAPPSPPPVATPATESAFDRVFDTDDDGPFSVDDFVRELDFDRHRVGGDPSTWQADLESRTRALSQQLPLLKRAYELARGTAETPEMRVECGPTGEMTDLTFLPSYGRLSPEEASALFSRLYGDALTRARENLSQLLADLGVTIDPAGPRE